MFNNNVSIIKRLDIYEADLSYKQEINYGMLPVIIVQNDIGNKYSPTTIIVPLFLASDINPMRVYLSKEDTALNQGFICYADYITTIDKTRIIRKFGKIDDSAKYKFEKFLYNSFIIK